MSVILFSDMGIVIVEQMKRTKRKGYYYELQVFF